MPQRVNDFFFQRAAFVIALAAFGIACVGGKEAPKTPLSEFAAQQASGALRTTGSADATPPLPHDALVALDSGNALYRLKRYADALVQYRLAAKRAPDDGAAYFGIYMVADATKNKPLLDSAVASLKARGMVAPVGTHK